VEPEEISVEDFVRREPRIICDSYIAGIADLYVKGLLQVYMKFPSTEAPEFYTRNDSDNVTQNQHTTTAETSDSTDDGLWETLRKLSLYGITDTVNRTGPPMSTLNTIDTPTVTSKLPKAKMVNVTIKDFTGSKDGSEDHEEFLDDIEFALDQMEEDQHTDKNRLRFFRQHLKGEAVKWWNLDMPHAHKKDWQVTVKEFTNKYGEGVQLEKKKWQIQNEIAVLSQHETESIASYVHRAKVIDRKSTPEMSNQLVMSFLRGIRDIPQKRMVEFSLGADKYTASFSAVIMKVMSSNQMIGEADPFDEDVSHSVQNLLTTPAYIVPPRMISSAAAAQAQIQPPNNKSDEALARILAILEKNENKSDFSKPAHSRPSGVNPDQQGIA